MTRRDRNRHERKNEGRKRREEIEVKDSDREQWRVTEWSDREQYRRKWYWNFYRGSSRKASRGRE